MKKAIENLDLQRQNELDVANTRLASMTSIQAEKNAINERYDSQRVKLVGDYNIEAAILEQKVYIEPKNIDEKDFICYSCKSILTLEGDELNQEIYTCPVCNKLNKITI